MCRPETQPKKRKWIQQDGKLHSPENLLCIISKTQIHPQIFSGPPERDPGEIKDGWGAEQKSTRWDSYIFRTRKSNVPEGPLTEQRFPAMIKLRKGQVAQSQNINLDFRCYNYHKSESNHGNTFNKISL